MVACGPGVERLAEEIDTLFPEARVELMTSDTIWSPTAAAEIVRRVQAHEIDILIGTQLVAKGHHFPMLTLVGVVDADLGLNGGDLRAAERTYQLLHQVAGRAGREDRPGRVLLQTHHPDHPVMATLIEGARDAFMAAEAEQRQAGNWPPFGRLAAIIVSGPDESHVEGVARALARNAPQAHDFKVLGPAPPRWPPARPASTAVAGAGDTVGSYPRPPPRVGRDRKAAKLGSRPDRHRPL